LYLDANFLAGHPRIYLSIGQTALNIGIACCIDRWVRFPVGLVAGVLNASAVRQIGMLSYSIYLWQQPFMSPESRLFMAFPLNLIPVFVFSAGSFYLIERPFQSLKTRLTSTPAKRMAAAAL
jgi:peptidoglycan/LPS O-acetylase OafA/YrhL